jgi:hypothetical protein
MGGDVAFGALTECKHACRAGSLGLAVVDWINAARDKLTHFACSLSRLGERKGRETGEAHVAFAAFQRVAKHPGFRPALAHLQIETTAVAVEATGL